MDGEKQQCVVDNFFPCRNQKPVFARNHGKELWVMILEKVWAKLHKSYEAISAGQPYEVFNDLLGAPSFYYKTNVDDIFDVIETGIKKEYIMVCTANPTGNDMKNQHKGIIHFQCYSILGIAEVFDKNGEPVNLIMLRNPWGTFEWKGDWSDKSDCWTDEAKRICKWSDEDDGKFWMSY